MRIDLLTGKQLQEELKVSRQSIYRWRIEGMPYIKFGKPVRYELPKVIEWLKERGGIQNE